MFDWLRRFRPLSKEQKGILRAMMAGWTLKSHRSLDGEKIYRLHSLEGESVDVPHAVVAGLERRGLLHSNQKFPAATYLLTERGRARSARVEDSQAGPLSARRFL